MTVMLQLSCLAAGGMSAVQYGSAGHHSLKCVRRFSIQSNLRVNFTKQHAFNQTERNKSAAVEFGWILSLRIFQGTGLDTTGLEETWRQHTPLIRALSM